MKKWLITFENGYCGCDEEEMFEGTYDEAVEWANEHLQDYAETMAHAAFGWEEPDEDEYDYYIENCGYNIVESEEDE